MFRGERYLSLLLAAWAPELAHNKRIKLRNNTATPTKLVFRLFLDIIIVPLKT
jgi:hypothetical protein